MSITIYSVYPLDILLDCLDLPDLFSLSCTSQYFASRVVAYLRRNTFWDFQELDIETPQPQPGSCCPKDSIKRTGLRIRLPVDNGKRASWASSSNNEEDEDGHKRESEPLQYRLKTHLIVPSFAVEWFHFFQKQQFIPNFEKLLEDEGEDRPLGQDTSQDNDRKRNKHYRGQQRRACEKFINLTIQALKRWQVFFLPTKYPAVNYLLLASLQRFASDKATLVHLARVYAFHYLAKNALDTLQLSQKELARRTTWDWFRVCYDVL